VRSATRGGRKQVVSKSGLADAGSGFWVLFVGMMLLVSGSALGVVYTTHMNRALLNNLQQLEKSRNQFQVEWNQLLLEQSSLISQGRLEEAAMSKLGMRAPALESVVIVTNKRD
jgi:cell division protein FtsL